jgi:alkylhydroperoxidase family enzyme
MAIEQPPRHPVRLAPLPREEWSEEAEAAIGLLPPQMQPPPGRVINSLSVLARNPKLASVVLSMTLYLRFDSTINARASELLIMRTVWLRGAPYELTRHAAKARREGWTDEEIARIAVGSAAPGWEPWEALLLRVAEDLCRDTRVSDATWNELADQYSDKELMDILFTVGTYEMMAMAFSSIGVQPEDDLPPFPLA